MSRISFDPKRWIEGSFDGDILSESKKVSPPNDRVLTLSCYDETTSPFSEPVYYDRVSWESKDKELIQRLKNKFGNRPDWFGYKRMRE